MLPHDGSIHSAASGRSLRLTSVMSQLETLQEDVSARGRHGLADGGTHDKWQGPPSPGAGSAKGDAQSGTLAKRRWQHINLVEGGTRNWAASYISNRLAVNKAEWERQRQRIYKGPAHPCTSIFGLPLLPPTSAANVAWISFMLLFDLIFTAFCVPISVGLCTASNVSLSSSCSQVGLFGGIVYLVNLLLSFQLGAVLEYAGSTLELLDGPSVAWCYIRFGRFAFDLIATIPLIYLLVILGVGHAHTTAFNVMGLVRLVRLGHVLKTTLSAYISACGQNFKNAAFYIHIVLLAYFVVVVYNLEACLLILVAYWEGLENSWMASPFWIDMPAASAPEQWYGAVYFVVTTATTNGYGDFLPHSMVDEVITNLIMITGLMMIGLVVGMVGRFTLRASGVAAEVHTRRTKLVAIGEWLSTHDVEDNTKRRVNNFFSQDQPQSKLVDIFQDVPHYVRHQLAEFMMLRPISSLKLLKSQDVGLRQLIARHMLPTDIMPGCDVCVQGQAGDRIWVLTSGAVEALQFMCAPMYVAGPALLGDSLILGGVIPAFSMRSFTLRSPKRSGPGGSMVVWHLRMVHLVSVLHMYPDLVDEMMEHVRNRTLVLLATGGVRREAGGSDWCEAATSISRTLLNQSQELVDAAIEELRVARKADGSLQTLLQTLLDFSVSSVHKHGSLMLKRNSTINHNCTRRSGGLADFGSGAVMRTPQPGGLLRTSLPALERTSQAQRRIQQGNARIPTITLAGHGITARSASQLGELAVRSEPQSTAAPSTGAAGQNLVAPTLGPAPKPLIMPASVPQASNDPASQAMSDAPAQAGTSRSAPAEQARVSTPPAAFESRTGCVGCTVCENCSCLMCGTVLREGDSPAGVTMTEAGATSQRAAGAAGAQPVWRPSRLGRQNRLS